MTEPRQRKIIGIMGPLGHGKSTVAGIIASRENYAIIPVASTIRAMLRALGLTAEELGDQELKALPTDLLCNNTPRHALQTLGVEWGRECIGEDVWINAWRHRVNQYDTKWSVLADDVRFINEVRVIRMMGGQIWRVTDRRKEIPEPDLVHRSELEWRLVDHDVVIDNSGTQEELRAQVHKVLDAQEAVAHAS